MGPVLIAIAAGASLMEMQEQEQAEEQAQEAQEQALQRQENQEKLAASEQQVARDNKLMQIQAQQTATAVSKGMALSSGTFQALSDESYNNFAKATKIGNLNLQSEENDINSKISASHAERQTQKWENYFGMIGTAAKLGMSAYQTQKTPNTTSINQSQTMNENEYDKEMDKTWNSLNNPENVYSNWLRNSQHTYE